MENSVKSSEVVGLVRRSRSLDLYVDNSKSSSVEREGEGSGLTRKRGLSDNEEFGLGQSNKRRKSRKGVSVRSFEYATNIRSCAVDVVKQEPVDLDEKDSTNDQISGVGSLRNLSGLSEVLPVLDGNIVPTRKRPGCLTRQKNSQSNRILTQGGNSKKASSDAQSVKFSGQSLTSFLSSEGKPGKVDNDCNENSSSTANSAQSFRDKGSAYYKYTDKVSKVVRQDRGKRREVLLEEHSEIANTGENVREDDEESLEENAARMLSSRFDPSCTVFSGNGTASTSQAMDGLSLGSTMLGDSMSLQSNHSTGLEANSAEDAVRVLRPRRKDKQKQKRHTRKRRHFYEIFSKDFDADWVISRRIKVFWPLDQSWYFGLVDSYDPERKLHHVKYDDREEEWVDLQSERFKLLLLPGEVPRKPNSRKSGRVVRSVAKDKENKGIENDTDSESEPLILWLARSTHRVKSSPHCGIKRRKVHSVSKSMETAMSSSDSGSTLPGYILDLRISSDTIVPCESDKEVSVSTLSCSLFDGSHRAVENKVYGDFAVPDKSDKEISVSTSPGCLVDDSFRADTSKISGDSVVPDKLDKHMSVGTLADPDKKLPVSTLSGGLVDGFCRAVENKDYGDYSVLDKSDKEISVSTSQSCLIDDPFRADTSKLSGMLPESDKQMFIGTLPGCLVGGHCREDASNGSSDSIKRQKLEKEVSEIRSPKDILQCVYSRKRYRQKGQWLGCTYDNSQSRSIVMYNPYIYCAGRFRQLIEHDMAHKCFCLADLVPGCLLWSCENLGLLKLTISPLNTKQVMLNLAIQLRVSYPVLGAETLGVCRTLLLLQYGVVMVMRPTVQLEMLFVDNVVGLRFLLFEGCLMQAVALVCMVLGTFHQPNKCGELLDQKIPVTSVRFEISGFPNHEKRFIFMLYNFMEVKHSKWRYLDNKLKQYCSVIKQLPLPECTYNNIRVLQSRNTLLPSPSVCREPLSLEVSGSKSRRGRMHKWIMKEPAYVNLGLSPSCFNGRPKRVPQFLLPFAAAPTFFMGLHFKLLMAKNMASSSFRNPLLLLGGPENCSRLVVDDDALEEFPDQVTSDHGMVCSLGTTADVSGLLSSAKSREGVDAITVRDESNWATTPQKHVNSNVLASSTGVQGSVEDLNNDSGELQRRPCHLLVQEQCATSSWPSIKESRSSQDKRDTELSRFNGIKVQIPPTNQVENHLFDGELQSAQQPTPDSVWSVNDCAISSPNPTAPRSVWHRNRHNSGSMSFGYRSKMWPDGRVDISHNGHVNGSKKPRSQISYLLPFGSYDFNSKPRSHHRKGRPYKRLRSDTEKNVPSGSGSPQRRPELLSCDANVLIIVGDKGWRECGARVVLECVDHNEWRLHIKVSGVTRYLYKAYQFLQPGTTNRYTHAMMWKGGKDWTLEFPDRVQWALFKEMHEECYDRNLRAASIKTIPIPGVRLIEEIDDNVDELPFVRSSSKYFMQVETDVDMALNPSRVLYDMDSDDERWVSKFRASPDASVSSLMEISEDMFERTMDMFEKVAYTQQREDFTGEEIKELMVEGVPNDLMKTIYEYWKHKRRRIRMPLIRQLQPPLWEIYQQQLKEWESSVNRLHHLPNGCKEKPPMFAFCLRPRGLELPNKGSKQRSHRKVSSNTHNYSFSRDNNNDHHHHHSSFGRKSNGYVYTEERHNNYTSTWQASSRTISPRDTTNTGYMSISSDNSERSHRKLHHRNKSRRLGALDISSSSSQMISTPRMMNTRNNGVVSTRPDVLDEFRLRDASSAAQHASNMAKLKREKAQRLLYRADLAIHKAMVALMTAEAMKASSEDLNEDG